MLKKITIRIKNVGILIERSNLLKEMCFFNRISNPNPARIEKEIVESRKILVGTIEETSGNGKEKIVDEIGLLKVRKKLRRIVVIRNTTIFLEES